MLRFSKHRGAFLFVLAAGLWSGPFVPVAQAQSLSPEHVELLQQLSPETAAQATKLLATAAQWRQRWQQINERLNAANLEDEAQLAAQAAGAEALQQLTTAVEAEIQKLAAPVREKLGPVLAALEEARAAWREAEQTAKTVEFIAEQNVGLTEAQFREKARRKALALAAHRVSPLVEQRVIVVVEALKNPVDYAQNFMQGEFDSWLREPREIAGEDGFKLKVVAPPQGVSVFSPNANLGVEIEYLPGSFNVKATGLYFEYRPGAAPRPVIDKLNVDASSGLLNQSVDKLKQFGNEILADMDLPVKITVTSLPDFTGARGPKGALTCTVELGLLGGKAKGKAEGIQLSPGNKVDWKGAVVTVEAPAKPPIPLGTTPFAIWKLIGSYGPSEKIFGFGAQISTAATPSEVIALDVRAKTSMPVKQIAIEGSLLVLTQNLAKLEGKIDFENGQVDGKMFAGVSGIDKLKFGDGSFSLNRERMLIDAQVQLAGKTISQTHAEFDFVRESARLTARDGFELFGSNFSQELQVELTEGFKSLRFSVVGSVYVRGVEPYGDLHASVELAYDSAKSGDIDLVVRVADTELRATVASLDSLDAEYLRKLVGKSLVQAYKKVLEGLASGEEDVREWGAKLDKRTREWADQNFGGAWQTGVPELDELGSRLSQEWKNAGGAVADLREGIGDGWVDTRDGLGNSVQGGLDTLNTVFGIR